MKLPLPLRNTDKLPKLLFLAGPHKHKLRRQWNMRRGPRSVIWTYEYLCAIDSSVCCCSSSAFQCAASCSKARGLWTALSRRPTSPVCTLAIQSAIISSTAQTTRRYTSRFRTSTSKAFHRSKIQSFYFRFQPIDKSRPSYESSPVRRIRRLRRLSPKSATVAGFGDSRRFVAVLSPKSVTIVSSVDRLLYCITVSVAGTFHEYT